MMSGQPTNALFTGGENLARFELVEAFRRYIRAVTGDDGSRDVAGTGEALAEQLTRIKSHEVQLPPGFDAGAPAAHCQGCGGFLSATRVEMRIERCSSCEGRPRKRRR